MKGTRTNVTHRGSQPKTVDEYLAHVPTDQRAALQRLRTIIKAAAPEATEYIGYGMPMYKHEGMLVSFAAFKNHLSFFVMSLALVRRFAADLAKYDPGKSTIHFQPDKPLPKTLVTKLVKARIAENETRRRERDLKRAAAKPRPARPK
jgi:uncharacterized protein YdhG (YjbR/CyaY superfamily)